MKALMQTAALAASLSVGAAEARQPNIVLLFADDLGWSDLGYRNPAVFESPNIDQLARDGIDFTQTYIACPTCSPSRATLLTGKHPVRLGFARHIPGGPKFPDFDAYGRTDKEFHLLPTDPAQFPSRNWLPLEHTTYAEALKDLGYYNVFFGKWHLGHEAFHPVKQGFDLQIGASNFGHPSSYYPPYFKNSTVLGDAQERYLTDRLTDEAVDFIAAYDRDQPFMLSLWYYAVHGPHQGRTDLVPHFEAKGLTGRYAQYAAMVKAMDESVGRVREALRRKDLDRETVVFFLSDQGGYFDNPPFHGGKRVDTLYEGGARVPFIVYWPGVTEAGAQNASLVQSTDLFPTFIEIAGGDPADFQDLDGRSLLSTLRNNTTLKRDTPLFGYRAYEDLYASVRLGDWKLLAYRSGTVKLYNLAEDVKEEHDLAQREPQKTRELTQQLIAWEKQMGVAQYSGVQ